jgi:osmotically-inducible protein OsmY
MRQYLRYGVGGVLLAALALGGCGGNGEERELAEAERTLREARDAVRTAGQELEKRESALLGAKAELDQAKQSLEQAEARLTEAEAGVDHEATDILLFRGIQERLLEEDRLRRVAIRVEVKRGRVVLHGTVPDEETRRIALELAGGFPGVAGVESRIQIASPAEPSPGTPAGAL